ncbi:DNA-dependent helicase II [compost metagenome]
MDYIRSKVNLAEESIAFLHPKGGGFFDEIRRRLLKDGYAHVDIKQRADWPEGIINIGLSTMHSAKGLEFDHVIAIGLSQNMMEQDLDEDDERMQTWRKLLAMAIGRAKYSVVLGYKPTEGSRLVRYLDPATYETVVV